MVTDMSNPRLALLKLLTRVVLLDSGVTTTRQWCYHNKSSGTWLITWAGQAVEESLQVPG